MQKVSDAPLQICENCGGGLEKQISLSGFQFKGAGWYVTDYASKSGVAATADKPEKSDKSGTDEKSSEGESTAKTQDASNKSSDTTVKDSKKETTAKKE